MCLVTYIVNMLMRAAVSPNSSSSGSWDSIHVFDAQDRARTAHYKLTSTVILSLGTETETLGGLDLSGNMVRQVEADMAVEDDTSHVANIGKMVEDMELKMRNLLQEVYFGKAKDVVGDLRSMNVITLLWGSVTNACPRHTIAQPDEQGPRDAKRDDQQHGPVIIEATCLTVHTSTEKVPSSHQRCSASHLFLSAFAKGYSQMHVLFSRYSSWDDNIRRALQSS